MIDRETRTVHVTREEFSQMQDRVLWAQING